jgi:energy-converting hydrogenase Eha subunit A
VAYIAFAACLGAIFLNEHHQSAALGALVGVLGALLRIWLEVRQHEPPE